MSHSGQKPSHKITGALDKSRHSNRIETLCPGHRRTAFEGSVLAYFIRWFVFIAFATLAEGNECAMVTVRGKHTAVTG